MEFEGNLAVVTGAANGFGSALANKCGSLGCNLALLDIDASKLEALVSNLYSLYPKLIIHGFVCDVSNYEKYKAIIPQIKSKFNTTTIQLLFNNIGISALSNVITGDLKKLRKTMDCNLWSMIYGTQLFLPLLLNNALSKQCYIINTGSLGSIKYSDGFYYITKHAVLALSQTITSDLNDYYKQKYKLKKQDVNIHVATLCPIYMHNTNFWKTSQVIHKETDEFMRSLKKENIPQQVIDAIAYDTEEVADIVFEQLKQKKSIIYTDAKLKDAVINDITKYYRNGHTFSETNTINYIYHKMMKKSKSKI